MKTSNWKTELQPIVLDGYWALVWHAGKKCLRWVIKNRKAILDLIELLRLILETQAA